MRWTPEVGMGSPFQFLTKHEFFSRVDLRFLYGGGDNRISNHSATITCSAADDSSARALDGQTIVMHYGEVRI